MIDKIILGTVQLGIDYGINNQTGKPKKKDVFNILNYAYENGIRILDTAEKYGNAHSEISEFHKKYNKKFKIITKSGFENYINIDLKTRILNHCNFLAVDHLHGFMFHNYQSLKKNKVHYLQLFELKKQGLIKKIGISLYNNNELLDIIENYNDFDFVQMPFNLLDNAIKRQKLFERAILKKIEIYVRSIFLQGLFFLETKNISKQLSVLKPYLNSLDDIKNEFCLDTASIALKYALEKDYINHVLIGVDNLEQLENNLSIVNKSYNIPHELIDKIDVEHDKLLNPVNWTTS
tara:strand:+ start:66 stop:941 length:876 start_codon:yes stop_codon:yes gene_type:complete